MDCFRISNAQAKEFAVSCFDVLIKDIRGVNDPEDTAIENTETAVFGNATEVQSQTHTTYLATNLGTGISRN